MSKNPIDELSGFCVVTGASSGIGLELAKFAAKDTCDLLIAADCDFSPAEATLHECGTVSVERIEVDLGSARGHRRPDALDRRPRSRRAGRQCRT